MSPLTKSLLFLRSTNLLKPQYTTPFLAKSKVLFLGPGALVAVIIWILETGITSVWLVEAPYKYSLLFVILISSIIAMQLQQMAGKLGIVIQDGPSTGNCTSCSQGLL